MLHQSDTLPDATPRSRRSRRSRAAVALAAVARTIDWYGPALDDDEHAVLRCAERLLAELDGRPAPRSRTLSAQERRRWMRERLAVDPRLAPHGTASTYNNWGCRCEPCTKAWAESCRDRAARRRARNAGQGTP